MWCQFMQATMLLEQQTDYQTETDTQTDSQDRQRCDPCISLIIQHEVDCKHAHTYSQLGSYTFYLIW